MIKRTLLAVIVLFLLSLPSLAAISLSGNKLSPIIYEPGKAIVNHYAISDTDYETKVTLGGDLREYISLSEVQEQQFDLTIKFPQEYIPAGSYSFSLNVQEVGADSAPFGSLLSVTKIFTVEVYHNEKEVLISLNAPSVNVGDPVNFQILVESRGYQDIEKIKSAIQVYDSERKLLATLDTPEKPLPALKSTTLSAIFPTEGLNPGEYWAQALVEYDGKQKSANATFRIGQLDLLLQNYTREFLPGFNEVSITVKNNWGNQLNQVYAQLFLAGVNLLQTAPLSLEPWAEGTLTGIIKVEQPPGAYPGKIILFFEGESKEEEVTFTVKEPLPSEEVKKMQTFRWFFISTIVIILLLLMAIILQRKKRKKNKNEF